MALNPEQWHRSTLRRRASTPLPAAHHFHQKDSQTGTDPSRHPHLGQSPAFGAIIKQPVKPTCSCSSDSTDSEGFSEAVFRVALLGDPGVGKSSLASIFAGTSDRGTLDQPGEMHECTLCVDGEETTLLLLDTWEAERQSAEGAEACWSLQTGNAYLLVYSVTDRSSFESASELRIQLRRIRQSEDIPIILVGNKTDLVRCREVSVEEGRACAMVFDCKFIETSAALHHNVAELFEGIVRQIRLRHDSKEANDKRRSIYKRKESLTKKACRFLDKLVARNNRKVALKVRSKSCHDLSVL
ncbi:GTP-binding protein REM 1 [Ambystoma mexicanum]|uniref:GTP-binding protein REM 1 n=1 Tax=Ambystoma mexicanum TaxID=8296 RepID=UPI0037E9300A